VTEYSEFSGVQPLLDEAEGGQEHCRSRKREGEQDPPDDEGSMLAETAIDKESSEPDACAHFEAE